LKKIVNILILFLPLFASVHHRISGTFIGRVFFVVMSIIYLSISFRVLINKKYLLPIKSKQAFLVHMFFIFSLLSLSRGILNDVIPLSSGITILTKNIILYIAYITLATYILVTESYLRLIDRVKYSLYLFIFVNFTIYLSGYRAESNIITTQTYGASYMAKLFGLEIQRVYFALAPGLQTYGILVGLTLLLASQGIFVAKEKKILLLEIVAFSVSAITIVMCDTRGSLLYFIIALVYITIYKNLKVNRSAFALIISMLSAFYILFTSGAIFYKYYAILIDFSRSNVSIVSSREIIWQSVIDHIVEFPDQLIMGYGAYSQYVSGVSNSYSHLFKNWTDPLMASMHNTYFQLLFDIGIIGFINFSIIVILFYSKTLNLYYHDKRYLIVIAIMTYMLLSGLTDGSVVIYNYLMFYPFIVITAFIPQTVKVIIDENPVQE
jgi:O-antigen ligase